MTEKSINELPFLPWALASICSSLLLFLLSSVLHVTRVPAALCHIIMRHGMRWSAAL